jgi:putative addiction module antidote
MNVTLRKIGNSEGVILPKELLESLNLKAGDKLEAIRTEDGIALRRADDVFERQMKAARSVMDKYKVALQKLAE